MPCDSGEVVSLLPHMEEVLGSNERVLKFISRIIRGTKEGYPRSHKNGNHHQIQIFKKVYHHIVSGQKNQFKIIQVLILEIYLSAKSV